MAKRPSPTAQSVRLYGSPEEADVGTPSLAYTAMESRWELIRALRGGTKAMREAGEKYLPREPKEEPEQYRARLNRSVLFNGYAQAADNLVAQPFSEFVTVEDAPEALESIAESSDSEDRDITALAADQLSTMIDFGLCHLLVDFPRVPEGASRAEELALGARPYFVPISPMDLIGWRTYTRAGRTELAQIRIREFRTEQVGEYGEEEIEYIRVWNAPGQSSIPEENATGLGTWEVHRKNKDTNKYELVESGTHTYPGIPLVTAYAKRTGFLRARPAMEDLAWMNLAHWQSESDQRNILRFARIGILFASGFSNEELRNGITIGPNRMVKSASKDAKLEYVEHTGGAITAGRDDLRDLEERMQALGMAPILRKTGTATTATASAIDESRSQSDLQAWVKNIESMLYAAYEAAMRWISPENPALPESFVVNIFSDFGITENAAQDAPTLTRMRENRDLSRETYLGEMRRRRIISESVKIDEEIERIESEALPPITRIDPNEDEDEDEDESDDEALNPGDRGSSAE